MKKSKFAYRDPRPFNEKVIDFMKSLLFWKGRKKGIVHTRDLKWEDIRAVFFPRGFYEKYKYLGAVPWKEEGDIFKAIEPLVIYMDYKAKPWWCPRWFLRFLHLFGSDNSIVRVRNHFLHNLESRITKGYLMFDYKTKWTDYDLRITVHGSEEMHRLAHAIETSFYDRGLRKDLAFRIQELDPFTKYHEGYQPADLKKELSRLGHKEY